MTKKTPEKPTRAPAFFDIESAQPEPSSVTIETPSQAPSSDPSWEIGPAPQAPKKRFSILALLLSTVLFLASLAGGLWLENLIRDLFARHEILGLLATGLTALAVLATLILIVREALALGRLKKITTLHQTASSAANSQSLPEAVKLANAVNALYLNRPDMARARDRFKTDSIDILDAPDLITITETDLLRPLDQRAKQLIAQTARRVAVVTAISPRAIVDLAYVAYESVKLISAIARLYGARPGLLGFFKLTRTALAHLAVTGGVAVGDSLIQQLVGHGLATKISSRVGEGFINGLMSVRVGIATQRAVRPLPFNALKPPQVADFIAELANFSKDKSGTKASSTKK